MTSVVLHRDRYTGKTQLVIGVPFLDTGEYYVKSEPVHYDEKTQRLYRREGGNRVNPADDLERVGEVPVVAHVFP